MMSLHHRSSFFPSFYGTRLSYVLCFQRGQYYLHLYWASLLLYVLFVTMTSLTAELISIAKSQVGNMKSLMKKKKIEFFGCCCNSQMIGYKYPRLLLHVL